MNETNYQSRQTDEIDLADFFRNVGNGIRSLFTLIAKMFRILLANFILFGGLLLLVAVATLGVKYLFPRYYRTEATFVSQDLDAKFCSMVLNSPGTLAGLNSGDNQTIINLNAEPTADVFTVSRYDTVVSLFKVMLTTKDTATITSAAAKIISILERNEYALKQREARMLVLSRINSEARNKLASLDSLKGRDLRDGTSIVELYQAQYFLTREIIGNERKMEMNERISVLQPFHVPVSPNTPALKKVYLGMIAGGILLAILLTLLFGRRRP